VLLLVCSTLLVSASWFITESIANGSWFITEFTKYQWHLLTAPGAGHSQNIFYHVYVLLLGCFPASIFFVAAFFKSEERISRHVFLLWMKILFAVVLIIFSLTTTKIIHYSSLCYFPITFFAAYALWLSNEGKLSWKVNGWQWKWLMISAGVIGFVLSAALIILPIAGTNMNLWIQFIDDPFTRANLEARVQWQYSEMWIGIVFLVIAGVAFTSLVKRKMKQAWMVSMLAGVFFVQTVTILIIPKIEQYTQGSAIRFYESLAQEDCYVAVLGFKSYAHWFYSKRLAVHSFNSTEWLLTGNIDKPVWFVSKSNRAGEWIARYGLQKRGEENGFVFLYRPASRN
jgi:4-amino-4-deoxy-L-arabinose transferase-like glycosyltransferase